MLRGWVRHFCSNGRIHPPLDITNSKFQEYTLTKRLPKLYESMSNELPKEMQKEMDYLSDTLLNSRVIREELPSSIHPKDTVKDKYSELHLANWKKFIGKQNSVQRYSLLEFIPAIISEMYFYHRIVDASGYFHGTDGKDPFLSQKKDALQQILENEAKTIVNYALDVENHEMEKLIELDLWGNKADLSLINHAEENKKEEQQTTKNNEKHGTILNMLKEQEEFLLCNDTKKIENHLNSLSKVERIDLGE